MAAKDAGTTLAGMDWPGNSPPVTGNSAGFDSGNGSPGAEILVLPELAGAADASAAGAPVKVPVGGFPEAPSVEVAAVPLPVPACGLVADEALS